MSSFLGNLHPKVKWPLIFNAVITGVLAIVAAATRADRNAVVAAVVSLFMTLLGAFTGYRVSAPDPADDPLAGAFSVPTSTAGSSGSGISPPATTQGGATPPGLNYPPIPEIPPIGHPKP